MYVDNECRYLIAIVKNDTNLIGTKKLDEIEWDNFQTRTLKGKFNCSVYDKSINRNIRIGLKLLNRMKIIITFRMIIILRYHYYILKIICMNIRMKVMYYLH